MSRWRVSNCPAGRTRRYQPSPPAATTSPSTGGSPRTSEPARRIFHAVPFTGAEVLPWGQRELERLQLMLSPSASLADGGVLMPDLPASQPGANWDAVWEDLFLHP